MMDSGAFWNLMGFAVAIFTGFLALGFSIYTFKKSLDDKSYSELDLIYMDILKIGMNHPEFRDPSKTSNYKESFVGDCLIKYDAYAYMVLNVCETIYDRTRHNEYNKITWEPVIDAEMRIHSTWIKNSENHHKFKKEFVDYVLKSKD